MNRILACLGLTLGTLFLAGTAAADQPLPPYVVPGPVYYAPAPVIPPEAYLPYYRTSRYDVWQYYGVDRQGRFRPRVIYSPYQPYYLYNGAPYYYSTTRPREWMSFVVD